MDTEIIKSYNPTTAYDNIKNQGEKALRAMFPSGIPLFAKSRFAEELKIIKSNESLIQTLEVYRLLSNAARDNGELLFPRGTGSGAFLTFLLGPDFVNPLPPYYYCNHGGFYELPETTSFGVDLPARTCPHCKHELYADGFRISLRNVFGTESRRRLDLDYSISGNLISSFRDILGKMYPDYKLVALGIYNGDPSNPGSEIVNGGFAVLPHHLSCEDYSDLHIQFENGEEGLLKDSFRFYSSGIKCYSSYIDQSLDRLVRLLRSANCKISDTPYSELFRINWSDIAKEMNYSQDLINYYAFFNPKSIKDLVNIKALQHNAVAAVTKKIHLWPDIDNLIRFVNSKEFREYPCFTRDDIYEKVLSLNNSEYDAFLISDLVRLGFAYHDSKGQWKSALERIPLPHSLKWVCEHYLYVFPRAHVINQVLKELIITYYSSRFTT